MLEDIIKQIKKEIQSMELDEQINTINRVKEELHKISPFKDEPADCVIWVKKEKIQANDYNPNKVASPEMKLLYTSIKLDGYTQPIVTYDKKKDNEKEIVDGFHRNRVVREHKDIEKRLHGYLPVTQIDKPLDERIGSTIRHNRARGTHQIRPMSEIVLELTREGWSDQDLCSKLGMELDEVIRLKQITGLKEAFQDFDFSKSWDEFETKIEKRGESI